MPDTFDVDTLFADLQHDVERITRGPGAHDAIRTSQRRRQTRRVSVVAAVALVVVGGGLAGGLHRGNSSDLEPAGRPDPAPAKLDASSLTAATAGWTSAWRAAPSTSNPQRTLDPSCHVTSDGAGAQSVGGSSGLFQTDDGHYVQFGALRYGHDGTPAQESRLKQALEACPGAQATDVTYADGSAVSFVRLPSLAGGTTTYGLALHGNDLMVLVIAPDSAMPDEVRGRLADAMVAALETDSNASALPEPGVSRVDPTQTLGQVWAEPLVPALAGWSTPWDSRLPRSDPAPDLALPACVQGLAWYPSGGTVNVGTDGFEWVKWFGSEASAVQAVHDLQQALPTCSTPYAVHSVTLPSGRPVVVAVGPQVLWFTRVASHVLVLQLPSGGTPPPDDVSVKVGALLEHVLQQPATTTVSPDGTTKVPDWLKQGIADAPTFGP